MNGKRAKEARRSIYGGKSFRARKYFIHPVTHVIIADQDRHNYQSTKKMMKSTN